MEDSISKIWDMVDEVVEENLDLFLEDEFEEEDVASNFESILEDSSDDADYEGNFGEDDFSEQGYDVFKSDFEDEDLEPFEKDSKYWLNEFENILEEAVPEPLTVQTENISNSRLPLILGGGGIVLLGLVTGVTVLIRLKRGQRFRALPVAEEKPVEAEAEVEVTPAVPEPPKPHQVQMVPGPLFILNQFVQSLMPRPLIKPLIKPLNGGLHE